MIQIGPDLYVHQPGSIYSPWGYLTEGLGAGGEVGGGGVGVAAGGVAGGDGARQQREH